MSMVDSTSFDHGSTYADMHSEDCLRTLIEQPHTTTKPAQPVIPGTYHGFPFRHSLIGDVVHTVIITCSTRPKEIGNEE